MAHQMLISKAENGFILEVVGELGGLWVAEDLSGLLDLTKKNARKLSTPEITSTPEPDPPALEKVSPPIEGFEGVDEDEEEVL